MNGNNGNFHPIGLVEDASFDGIFSGHFDGQNHTIKGLRYTNKIASGSNYNDIIGLFKTVDGSSAVVERVVLIDPQISGTDKGCGGIAGLIRNGATIRNCTVLGGTITRTGNGKSGGIVGSNSSNAATIEGCTVIGTSVQDGMIIGYGNSQQTIKDCIYYDPNGIGIAENTYTDGGGNQRVYQLTLGDDVTTSTAATYSSALLPSKAYYTSGATVTLGHAAPAVGYDFGGYESSNVTISEGAFTMPASDVTVSATWTLHTYTITYNAGDGATFSTEKNSFTIESDAITLDEPTRTGYDFGGWYANSGLTGDAVTTIAAGSTGDVELWAKWTENVLELADAASNATAIADAAASGKTYNRVTLQGRTLYKDGAWNTLCLPFNAALEGSPLEGATLMELDTEGTYDTDKKTGVDGEILYLYFKTASSITAGKPYLIKWASGDPIVNPVFSGVTISSTAPTEVKSSDNQVIFVGQYAPFSVAANNTSVLNIGSGNTIGYAKGRTLKCFRAHFELSNSSSVKSCVMSFGDDGTSISLPLDDERRTKDSEAWYTLDGRKLEGKSMQKGIYINNGLKVTVK
ncbi:MAG: InlB B-repeat-containing protein [Bacteroidaceae bacterium]|nr:InlB B-repeat-containing protein [Bacteroidaceae bacterium]